MEKKKKRPQTPGEELANTISHGAGAVLAALGALPLMIQGAQAGPQGFWGMGLYALSLVGLYGASAAYHGAKDPERKARLQVLDHCSIFLLILGTYIPLALLTLGGNLGWILIGLNTLLAVVGIALNLIDLNRFSKVSLVLYAAMGWLILPALRSVVQVLPVAGVALLASGGVAYTAGIAFYKSKKRYMHFVWHLFVLAGSILQYLCVLFYCV